MRTRVKNRNPKHSMPFLVRFQVNEHNFLSPKAWKIQGILQLHSCQTARKSRLHDLSTHFGGHILNLRRSIIVPLNLKRKDFISHAVLQIVNELILINCNCKVLIKLLLLIFYEYLSKFLLVSLVRFCDAVGNSLINLQVWALLYL